MEITFDALFVLLLCIIAIGLKNYTMEFRLNKKGFYVLDIF